MSRGCPQSQGGVHTLLDGVHNLQEGVHNLLQGVHNVLEGVHNLWGVSIISWRVS